MSRGLGAIQRGCLQVIADYEAEGRTPTTFNIAAEVYHVERDRDGNRMVSDAQHVAVKRALSSLQRQGFVTGWRDSEHTPYPPGHPDCGKQERSHYWRRAD